MYLLVYHSDQAV